MTKFPARSAPSLAALGAMLALLNAGPAHAISKVWVANTGTDGVVCGAVTSPCRTFQQAHDIAASGGEVGVLTPGDYGRFTITKSVAVTNDGSGEASVLVAASTYGVVISAGAGDIVSLRGLVIDGGNVGAIGIYVQTAAAVHVQNCVVRNLEGAGAGISLIPPGTINNIELFVSDTMIFNNGSIAGTAGVLVRSFVNSARVVLDRVHVENNVIGIFVDGSGTSKQPGARVLVRDSVVAGNTSDGILAFAVPGSSPAFVVVEHTSVANNAGIGIHADGPHATIVLNDDTVTGNGAGISIANSGQLISFGNNKNFNNIGPEGAPTGFLSPM